MTTDHSRAERLCYPGLLPVVLGAVGLIAGRREAQTRLLGLLLGSTAILALGPRLVITGDAVPRSGIPLPYELLHALVPGFSALRVPARLTFFIALILVPLSARGAGVVLSRAGRAAPALALALLALHFGEAWPRPFPRSAVKPRLEADPAYRMLAADASRYAVVEIPFEPEAQPSYMMAALHHGKPIVNGYTSHYIREVDGLTRSLGGFPSVDTISALRKLTRDGIHVERVIWRDEPGWGGGFARARRFRSEYPGAPILEDFGDILVFGLRPLDDLVRLAPPATDRDSRWGALPIDRFTIDARHSDRDRSAIRVRRPASIHWRLPLMVGRTAFRARVATSPYETDPSAMRLRVALDELELFATTLPSQGELVVETPPVEVRTAGRYRLAFEVMADRLRPNVEVTISEIEIAAPEPFQ